MVTFGDPSQSPLNSLRFHRLLMLIVDQSSSSDRGRRLVRHVAFESTVACRETTGVRGYVGNGD